MLSRSGYIETTYIYRLTSDTEVHYPTVCKDHFVPSHGLDLAKTRQPRDSQSLGYEDGGNWL